MSSCAEDDSLDARTLRRLQRHSFDYFVHEVNRANGLVRDKTAPHWPASIAAMGMALSAYPVGVERGFIERNEAAQRTLAMLRFLAESEQSESPEATGYKGFYYHFLHMQTGRREWQCELSSIDTALLIAGALGISASDGPGTLTKKVAGVERVFFDDVARGAPYGPDDGTVAPWAVAAALCFAPEIVAPTITHMAALHVDVPNPYGFKASFNPVYRDEANDGIGWVSPYHFGINEGPTVLMIENHRSQLLWRLMRSVMPSEPACMQLDSRAAG